MKHAHDFHQVPAQPSTFGLVLLVVVVFGTVVGILTTAIYVGWQ